MKANKLLWMFACAALLVAAHGGCRQDAPEPVAPPVVEPGEAVEDEAAAPTEDEAELPPLPQGGMVGEQEEKPAEAAAAVEAPAEAKPAEKPAEEKPVEEKPVEVMPAEEKPAEKAAEEKPAEEKPVEEKPAEAMPAEEKPAEKPAEKKAAEEKPVEEKPVEAMPAEEKPAEEKPAEEKPAEEKPAEESAKAAAPSPEQVADLVKVPAGLPPLPVPKDNPMTVEKVALGKMLYFDKRLSSDGTISCATCHDPKMAWAEHEPTSTGINKQVGGRNSPTVINAAYATSQFWDGRAASLEEQALGPVENPIEMGHKMEAVVEAFAKIPAYQEQFKKVFGRDINKEDFARAIAAFERTVLSGNSPYDKFKAGEENALSEAQKRGMETFEDAGCSVCHTPPLFSNYRFYNAGVGADKEKPDPGRKEVTGRDSDMGSFRVPALREAANTGPYFHDGSAKTLEEAVALMAAGGKDNPNLSSMMKAVREAELTAEDQKDLVEFLKALSGEFPVVEPPQLP